jgi:hypothetical protein
MVTEFTGMKEETEKSNEDVIWSRHRTMPTETKSKHVCGVLIAGV